MKDLNYYAMDKRHSTFVAIRFRLDNDIRTDILQKALDKCRKRVPYFFVKLAEKGGNITEEPNDKAFVIHEDPLDYLIDEQNNDDFLIRLSVSGNNLTGYFYHGLTDASGFISLLKLLLSEYYRMLGEKVVLPEDILDINGPVAPEEIIEPLELLPVGTKSSGSAETEFYSVKGKESDCFTTYIFSAAQEKVMAYASSFDGSPNAIAAIALARAISGEDKAADKLPIDIAIAINAKPVLGCGKSHYSCVYVSKFSFVKKTFAMDEMKLQTCVRGRIIADSSETKLFSQLANTQKMAKIFEAVTRLDSRRLICTRVMETPRATATISYVGAVKWGSMENHIKSIHTFTDSAMPILEINYINGKFYFALTSRIDTERYARRLYDYFNKLGFECEDFEKQVFRTADRKAKKIKFGLNRATIGLLLGMRKLKKQS